MDLDLLLNAIYKTLLHSLWQGVLLAVVGGSIMLLGRQLKSSVKYILLTFSLLLFLGGVAFTFSLEMNTSYGFFVDSASPSPITLLGLENTANESLLATVNDKIYGFYDYYLAHYDRAIVVVWFAIMCLKVAILFFDMYGIHRLRSTKIRLVDDKTEIILKAIRQKLSLKKNIPVFESAIVKTPLVIGALKPLILLPIGLATSMTIEQIEAILAHEMAHIKRKDFLVNIIQSTTEIIFFFNPSVLWISSLIRNERELCCDNIAIEITGNKTIYINTLVECVEYRSPSYSMAFAGNKKLLLNRVKRILGVQKSSLNSFDKFFLGLCLVSAIFTTGILSTNPTYGNDRYFLSSFIDDPKASQNPNRVNSDAIIEQLKKSNIISDPSNFSVKITNFALYVNGDRQSKILHRQILEDFVKDYKRRLHFTKSVKSVSN